MKKITLMLSIFLGTVCLLAGCGNPYAKMKLTVSDKEVVLYLDTNDDGERETTSQSVDVTITGAKKGVSTDIVVSNALENIVSISTLKNGNTTKLTFTANENATGNSADIVVRSKEGGLSDTIRVTVYEKVKDIAFSTTALAVKDGGQIALADYVSYEPAVTNQRGVYYTIKEQEDIERLNEYITLTEEGTLSVASGTVTNDGSDILPFDQEKGLYYVTLVIQSKFEPTLVDEKKVYVVPVIKASDVVIRSQSNSGKVDLSSTLTDVTVQDNGQTLTLNQIPTYSVVLANNVNTSQEFLYSRTLEFLLDPTSFRRDSMYTVSLLQQKYLQSDRNFIHVSKLERNAVPNDQYEYNTFRFDQVALGQDVLVFKIDYTQFENMLTCYIALDIKVQNFATEILATVAGDEISSIEDDSTSEGYKTINVLNSLNGELSGYTCVTLTTNYDKQNKGIKLSPKLLTHGDLGVELWNIIKNHIFACDKEGNPIPLDGSAYVDNGEKIYFYHDLSPLQVQNVKDKIALEVQTTYDLNPVENSEDMKFPYSVTKTFPMTMHTNMVESDVVIKNNALLNVTLDDELTLLTAQPGVYATNFFIDSDRRNTKVVRKVSADGTILSSVYVDNQLLFYVIQKDDVLGGQNTITLKANNQIITGSTYLTLEDKVHDWYFVVKVEVYAPLAYSEREGQVYFASRIPNENKYKGQWITNSKQEITLNLGQEEQRIYQSIQRIKLATTKARDKNSLEEYIPIEIFNVVKLNGTIYEIDLLKTATISPNSSRYFYYERGKIYPFNREYLDENHPLTLSFTVSGYDMQGQAQTLTYTIELLFVDVIESVQLECDHPVLYENSSLGIFDQSASTGNLNIKCVPHTTNDVVARYAYVDQIVQRYVIGNEQLEIKISDLIILNEQTGEIKLDYTQTSFGISKITRLQSLFGSVSNVLQNIFASPISVKVEVFAKQEQLDSLYDSTFITLDYAEKVQYIYASNLDEQGVYLEKASENGGRYASKSITLSVLPNQAYNKTLRIVYSEAADASMIRFAQGQVDEEGRIVSSNQTLTFYPEQAGEMILYIAAEDSFRQDALVAGKYNPDTTIAIRVKVADGSKAYPFEIADQVDFMNIGNGYSNGTNNYHYMLANNIDLSRNTQTRSSLFGGTFNGSITGLMRYEDKQFVQKTISGYCVQYDQALENIEYCGLFEKLGEQAEVSNLILSSVDVSYVLNTNQNVSLGILAGKVAGILDNNIVTGQLKVENKSNNSTLLTIGGVVGELTGTITSTHSSDQLSTNFSLNLTVTAKHAYVGGLVGSVQGTVQNQNGFSAIVSKEVQDRKIVAGGLVGHAENANIVDNIVQTVINGDEVGGLVAHADKVNMGHNRVELLDSIDTKSTYGLYGTNLVGGLVAQLSNSQIRYSYVRSYNKTVKNYVGDLVLATDGTAMGGLVAKHEDESTNSTTISNSYFEGGLTDNRQDSNDNVGAIIGYSSNYQDQIYTQETAFLQNSYAKVNSGQISTLVGNYHGVSALVNISKIGLNDVTSGKLTTTLVSITDTSEESVTKDNQTIDIYQLPNDLVNDLYTPNSSNYAFYTTISSEGGPIYKELENIRELTSYDDGIHPYITNSNATTQTADIEFTSLSNNEQGYYIYRIKDTTSYVAVPNIVEVEGVWYKVELDVKSYVPVKELPRQAIVPNSDELSTKGEYVDGIVNSYLYQSEGCTVFGNDGKKVMPAQIPSYLDYVELWKCDAITHREDVYFNGAIDWSILKKFTYYLEDGATSQTLNDNLPVLVDVTNGKLLYNILPTDLVVQIVEEQRNVTDNHYYLIDKDAKTAIVYYNVLQSQETVPSGNNEYFVGLTQEGVSIATYILSVNEDFGGDTRVSVISSNPQVVRVAENNKIVICGLGESTITVRSLLDREVYDTFTIVTTYGIRGISLFNANNEQIKSYASTSDGSQENNNLQGSASIIEYIKEHQSFYSLSATNTVVLDEHGIQYHYQPTENFKLKVTIEDYAIEEDGSTPSMMFAGHAVSVKEGNVVIDNTSDITSFVIDNPAQLTILAQSMGRFRFSLTPVISVNSKDYELQDVSQFYVIDLKNKAQSISFDKGATSTSFALSGSGSSSELGIDFVTYNEKEELYMQVLDFKGNVIADKVIVGNSTITTYNYLTMKLTDQSVVRSTTSSAKTLHYHFELTFDQEAYLKNILSTDQADSLNNQQYTLIFTCESNDQLEKTFAVDMHALPVSEMASYFYPSAQNKDGQYYPQENASTYLVPNRIGLVKSNVYPLLNDIDYFEYTVSPEYRQYIRLTQFYNNNDNGYVTYSNTEYLPDFAGIRLHKISSYGGNNNDFVYDGNYYVGVTTSANCPAGGQVELQLTGYKIVDGVPVAVSEATKSIALDVIALPKVDLVVDGTKEAILANGYTKQLGVALANYTVATDGPVEFVIEALLSKNNSTLEEDWSWSSEGLQGKYRVTDTYLFETIDGTIGDTIRITAKVKKVLNGVIEESTSSVIIRIVAYEITGIQLQGYPSSNLELLNGTQNHLLGDIIYRGQPTTTNLNDIRLLNYLWNGALAIGGDSNDSYIQDGRFNPFRYVVGQGLTNVPLGTSIYNNAIKFVRSQTNSYIFAETQKIANDLAFQLVLNFYYNESGVPTLYTGQKDVKVWQNLEYNFTITIKENSTYDRPTPIYTVEDFYALEEYTQGHYILMNNLTLNNHIPFNLNVDSFDGNSHSITIDGFDLGKYQEATSAEIGLFNTVGENSIIKNLTIDVHPLLTNLQVIQVVLGKKASTSEEYEQALNSLKLNFSSIASVHFGVVAVTNNGTLSNIKVVSRKNIEEEIGNKYLFVYTTQDFLSGNRTDASIAGLVYENGTNGVITNSIVGINYASDDGSIVLNTATYSSDSDKETVSASDADSLQQEDMKLSSFTIAGGKELAGLVATNSGIIASSYVYGIGLLNTASLASEVYTGGVVVNNRGTIFASFVEGLSDNDEALRANTNFIIESTGLSGGFAYSNSGTIYDCYANIALSTNSGRTGDFIFTNSGTLRNCYTTATSLRSKSEDSSTNQEIRTYHGVFTGIGSDLTINNTGTYSGCYYLYLNGETESKVEHAAAINGTGSEEQSSNFTNIDYYYGYSMGASEGSSEYIWGQTQTGPKLNFSSYTTTSIRKMIIDTSSAEGGWNYMYFAEYGYGTANNPILITSGEELVTTIINNAVLLKPEDKSFVFGAEVKKSTQDKTYVVRNIRLVRNIEVTSTLVNQAMVNNRYLRDVTFAGVLDGNGMKITIENLNDELYQQSKPNFGLFSQIGLNSTTTVNPAIIKNTKFVLRGNVTSTNAQNVGMLAGSIYNATIIDVEVSASEGATVSGSNAVGGIAGVIGGESTLLNVSSNISVSSVYDSGVVNKENATDLDYDFAYSKYAGMSNNVIQTKNTSYAGGIAGILDCTMKNPLTDELSSMQGNKGRSTATSTDSDVKENETTIFDQTDRTSLFITEQSESKIMNLKVYGYVQIVGEHAGGLFGYVGKTSHVKHSTFEIDPTTTQRIVGHNYAGGVVAENHGYLEEVYVDANASKRIELDATLPSTIYGVTLFQEENANIQAAIYPTAIGGIAGYNEGAIYNSYSKANVANANAFVAGGVVGLTSGVTYLSHVYTTAFVHARRVIGGVIGFVREGESTPITYLDYVTGYNSWDTVADKTTNNLTYTILYNLYKEHYKDENGRQLSFTVRMPQVGNQQAKTYTKKEDKYELTNQAFTRTTYLGSLIGRVGRAVTSENGTLVVNTVTNQDLQNILKTRLNAKVSDKKTTIYADLDDKYVTNNNTIYTTTSNYAVPNNMPNKTVDILNKSDDIYYEDMLGIQKPYETLKNGQEFKLDESNGGYENENGQIDHYPIVTEMVSNNWIYDKVATDTTNAQSSIHWYYDAATSLPIMIEGVNPVDNTISNGNDYSSKLLLDAMNKLTANKTYSVTADINNVTFENRDQSSLIFQGALQGVGKDKKKVELSGDQTFNILRNASISNLSFVIDVTNINHGKTPYIDNHTAFGYFADFVYHSTIRDVDITLVVPKTITMIQERNMINDYYGILFGYVADSTIENVTLTISVQDDTTNAVTLTGPRYENVGVFAGGIQGTSLKNISVGECSVSYNPNMTNVENITSSGYAYDSTITMGSFAGVITNASTLDKVTDAVGLTIVDVASDSDWRYSSIHIGSVGLLQSSVIREYEAIGDLTVEATNWISYTKAHIYIGRGVGSASGSTLSILNTLGNITYNGNKASAHIGGLVGKDTSSTLSLQKATRDSGQLAKLTQKLSITSEKDTALGGVVGDATNSSIKNIITNQTIDATIASGDVGGLVGKASSTTLEKVMYDSSMTIKRQSGTSKINMGGVFGRENASSANTFVVSGKLTYASDNNDFALAGLSAIMEGSDKNYTNGIVSPVLEQSSNTYTLCKNKQIEPLTTSDSDNGRIDSSVKYPYELYLYEGMEELGDISATDANKNAMRYVDFINTYYMASEFEKGSLQDTFKYEIGESGTRYNPNRISSDSTIGANSKEYFIVKGAHTITFDSTFNGVLIGKNTQDLVATSSSNNITNNGIIANVKFGSSNGFANNAGVLFNVMAQAETLANTNAGYILNSSVVVESVTDSTSGLFVTNNTGTILNSYAIGNIASGSPCALVAKNSGTIRNSYYAGNIPTIMGGATTGSNVSGIYADAYALEKKPTTDNSITYLSTTDLQKLGDKISGFANNESLQYNYGYPYIQGGMIVDRGTISEYNIYNQADWVLVMTALQNNAAGNAGITVNIAKNFTFANMNDFTGFTIKGIQNNPLTINGNNHTITINESMKNNGNNFGLLSSAEYVTIQNLTLSWNKQQTLAAGTSNAGGLIGTATHVTLNNVNVNNFPASGSANKLGGVIGQGTNVTVDNNVTVFNARLTNNNTNGALGAFAGSINNLNNNGTITINGLALSGSAAELGGAIGRLSGSLNGTIVTTNTEGNITAGSGSTVGGLLGLWTSASGTPTLDNSHITINRAANAGTVTTGAVGGLVGQLIIGSTFTIDDWTFTKSINNSSNTPTGGLVGKVQKTSRDITLNIANVSTTSGKISSTNGSLGGLIGSSDTNVTIAQELEITTTFNDTAENLGGIIGKLTGTLTVNNNITLSKNMKGKTNVGGLVGYLEGGLSLNTNTISIPTAITSTQGNAGGLVGTLNGFAKLTALTLTAKDAITVTGQTNAGGLVGAYDVNSYKTIEVSTLGKTINVTATSGYAGGLIGYVTSSNSMTYTISAAGLNLGTIQAEGEGYSAGGLVGYSDTSVNLNNITMDGLTNFKVSSKLYAGGLIGQVNSERHVTVIGDITFGPDSGTLERDFISGTNYSGGLFGHVGYLTVNTGKTITVQNITMNTPKFTTDRGFAMVVGYVRQLTNDGTIVINNVKLTTTTSNTGLVVGRSVSTVNGTISITNSTIRTEKKNVKYLGLVSGYANVKVLVTLDSSAIVIPDRQEKTSKNTFDFDTAATTGYRNQQLTEMISDSIGNDFSKLWIQNAENEQLSQYNDKWYGKLSKDKTMTYKTAEFPYWMSWGGDDTIIVSTTDNFANDSGVSAYDYFRSSNINATFNPNETNNYDYGLVTGYGNTLNSQITNNGSIIKNPNNQKVKIGSFNKMVFVYMEEWNWGCNKWLVMEFSYYINETQNSSQSYRFGSDFQSSDIDKQKRIEVKFANSWTKLGDDEKPNGSTMNTFHYNKVTRIVEERNTWDMVMGHRFETTSHKYARITSANLQRGQSWFDCIFGSKLSLETTYDNELTGKTYADNRVGIIQQCMGWKLVEDNRMAIYPAV